MTLAAPGWYLRPMSVRTVVVVIISRMRMVVLMRQFLTVMVIGHMVMAQHYMVIKPMTRLVYLRTFQSLVAQQISFGFL